MRVRYGLKLWAGPIIYLIALIGTWLLANESFRPWAVSLLVASAVLAIVLWGRQNWTPIFPSDVRTRMRVDGCPLFYLLGVTIAVLFVLAADLRYAAAPNETFGLAGILWTAGIALLLCSTFFASHSLWGVSSAPDLHSRRGPSSCVPKYFRTGCAGRTGDIHLYRRPCRWDRS